MLRREDPQMADAAQRLVVPVHVERAGVRVEEDHLGRVRALVRLVDGGGVEVSGEQRVAARVPGEHVTPTPEHEARCVAHAADQLGESIVYLLDRGIRRVRTTACRRGECVQVPMFGVAQPESPGERVDHLR